MAKENNKRAMKLSFEDVCFEVEVAKSTHEKSTGLEDKNDKSVLKIVKGVSGYALPG